MIQNYGNVYGESTRVYLDQTDCAFFNAGTVSGPTGVYISAPNTQVFNSGTIVGTVALNDGNDLYLGREMGTAYDGVLGGAGNDYLQGSAADDYFEGGGGQDKLIGNAGFGGSANDTLIGGDGDDTLAGGNLDDKLRGLDDEDLLEGGNGIDTLIGGRGEDTLIGGNGLDYLTGGVDADVFMFTDASESPAGSNRDRIKDFDLGVDLIDVSGIASFTFIGTAAFSNTPGELRLFESQNGNIKVDMDIDGNGVNDVEITVSDIQGLTEADFIL